jgi:hypothetical protein
MKSRALLYVLLSVFLALAVCAQTQKELTNSDIVKMTKQGFEPGLIVKAIESSSTDFDISAQALLDLKNSGVQQSVMEAMLAAQAKKPSSTAEASHDTATPAEHAPVDQSKPVGNANGGYLLREGTQVPLKFASDLSSKTAAEGDPVSFVLAEDIWVGNVVVAAAGAKAVGEVSHVKKAGMMGKGGELNVRLDYLRAGDVKVRLRGTKGREGEDKIGTAVALTVLFGPIGLIKHGKNIDIPEGTALSAFVAADVNLPGPTPPPGVASAPPTPAATPPTPVAVPVQEGAASAQPAAAAVSAEQPPSAQNSVETRNTPAANATNDYEYRLIFATETSQLQKDINQAATEGFRAAFMTAGDTHSGPQILVLMVKDKGSDSASGYQYQILVSGRASLVEKGMNQFALDGFQYRAWTMVSYKLILMEKRSGPPAPESEYRLITWNRRETLQKEIDAAAEQGFRIESMGGGLAILSRPKGLEKARYLYNLVDTVPESPDNGFALRWFFGFGFAKMGYVMERDLNKAPEKTQYRILSVSQLEDVQARLRLAQQEGFCLVNALFPSGVFGGNYFAMKKMNEKCDHIYIEDLHYYEDGQYYQAGWVGKGNKMLPFLEGLNKWGSQGYEVVGFGPLKAVMIKQQRLAAPAQEGASSAQPGSELTPSQTAAPAGSLAAPATAMLPQSVSSPVLDCRLLGLKLGPVFVLNMIGRIMPGAGNRWVAVTLQGNIPGPMQMKIDTRDFKARFNGEQRDVNAIEDVGNWYAANQRGAPAPLQYSRSWKADKAEPFSTKVAFVLPQVVNRFELVCGDLTLGTVTVEAGSSSVGMTAQSEPAPVAAPAQEGASSAQPGSELTFSAVLIDTASKKPVPSARIILAPKKERKYECTIDTSLTAVSNDRGEVRIPNVGPGEYVVFYNLSGVIQPELKGKVVIYGNGPHDFRYQSPLAESLGPFIVKKGGTIVVFDGVLSIANGSLSSTKFNIRMTTTAEGALTTVRVPGAGSTPVKIEIDAY